MPVGIILSAGSGSRLRPITSYLPKPLIPVGGRRIIDFVMSFMSAKCERIVVITGYMSELMESYLKRRYNVNVLKVDRVFKGNLYTLLRAKELALGGDLLVANADHIFPRRLWKFFPQNSLKIQIACHRKETRPIMEDEMKVKLRGSKFYFMDKFLREFEGAYVGLTYVPEVYNPVFWKRAIEVFEERRETSKVEDVLNSLREHVEVVWIDHVPFLEIDNVEDLRAAWRKIGSLEGL